MKRLTAVFLILSLALECPGKTNDEEIRVIQETLRQSRLELDYSFESAGSLPISGKGHFTAEGNSYKAEGNGIAIICDGISRWMKDSEAKEVYIEKAGGVTEILNSPEIFLNSVAEFKKSENGYEGLYINPSDGSALNFKLKNIRIAPLGGHPDEFVLHTDWLDKSWVITDLR